MTATISAIAYSLPAKIVSNADLAVEHPEWDMTRVETRTGVLRRHIADGETALDLACRAADALIADHPAARMADAILFCTQTPDQVMPPNSALLHEYLGLGDGVFALDFNLACSGFVYGLAQAQGLLAAGIASSILLVTADTYSRLIDPDDRGPRVLFGDGAAITWITQGDRGLVDIALATSGRDHRAFMVPKGSQKLHMNGFQVLGFVQSHVPNQVNELLTRNGLTIGDIDLFVFHQASRLALDTLERLLGIPKVRMYSNLERVGNTVSASIPMALQDAMAEGRAGPGSRVLLCGFGVGMSWASAIIDL
jgi:3-oxoacyl-[acyl-carrier-protein] synthase III